MGTVSRVQDSPADLKTTLGHLYRMGFFSFFFFLLSDVVFFSSFHSVPMNLTFFVSQ